MSLLVVGSVAIDSIETPHGVAPEIIGGSAVHFAYAASLFVPVRLVGVVGEDFPGGYLEILRARPIDLSGLEVRKGKSFRWSGRYQGAMAAAETLSVELNLFGQFDPTLPSSFRSSQFVFLANGSPHVQRRVLAQIDARERFVLLDTMNLWIEMERRALVDLLAEVDAIVINDEEIRQLTGEANLIAAGREVLRMGPSVAIVKKGEHGALLFQGERIFAAPAWPIERVYDPTGAGDTFAGGIMGALARSGKVRPAFADLRRAVCMGIVLGSFNVEDFGLERLRRARSEEIEARWRDYVSMLAIDPEMPALDGHRALAEAAGAPAHAALRRD
jgi:sugar/nucleoside kinase (ribokinase family)